MGQILSSFFGFPAAARRFYRSFMGIPGIEDLPPEVLQTILLKVGNRSYTDLVRCKKVCTTMRHALEKENFYRTVDLFTMEPPRRNIRSIVHFYRLCVQFENPSALFILGTKDFFRTENMEEGFLQIQMSAERGYDLGIYTYAFLTKIMFPGVAFNQAFVNPNPSREFIMAARRKVMASQRRPRRHDLPSLYVQRAAAIDVFYDEIFHCPCQEASRRGATWDEWCKPDPCDACFWKMEALSFREELPRRVVGLLLEYPENAV